MKIDITEREALDVTSDYEEFLKKVSLTLDLPIGRLIIEEHPCGEDCIFDTRTGRWLGYISDYFEGEYNE